MTWELERISPTSRVIQYSIGGRASRRVSTRQTRVSAPPGWDPVSPYALFRYCFDHPVELLQVEPVRDVTFIVKPNVSGAVDQIELGDGLRFVKLFDGAIAEENRKIVSTLFGKLDGVSLVGIRAD